MSKTNKQKKWYAITTKTGKRIPAQYTKVDEVIPIPLHFFNLKHGGGVEYIASQNVVAISKHTTISLVSKDVYQALIGLDLDNTVQIACEHSAVIAVINSLNEQYPKWNLSTTPDSIKVEVYAV